MNGYGSFVGHTKLNLLHLILTLDTGGMERFVCQQCLSIDKNIFNVSVCCMDDLGLLSDVLIKNNIKVDLVKRNPKKFEWSYLFKLKKYLKKNKVQVLNIHSGAYFIGAISGALAGVPVIVYTEHGRHYVEPRFIKVFDNLATIFCNKIITVSHALKEHLVNNIKLPSKKIEVVVNGVDVDEYIKKDKSRKLIEEFNLNNKIKVIGTVGRLVEVKDHYTLINAYEKLRKKIKIETKLIIVGSGPCLNSLKDLVRSAKLEESVIFAKNRDDISDILNIFDIFVLSSLMEGTSISLLEAMSCGLPSVVTNVGGNTNLVKNNYNGFLFEPKDSEALCEKLFNLLMDDSICEFFSNKSRETIVNNHSHLRTTARYGQIYLEEIKKKRCRFK